MAVIQELIRTESDGTLSFGDYTLAEKSKIEGYEFEGDSYKVKTFKEITKLEKNGMFAYESVPGTAVESFAVTEEGVAFKVYAAESVQFTVGLEEESLYEVFVEGESVGRMTTNLSGKLSLSVDMNTEDGIVIEIVKR